MWPERVASPASDGGLMWDQGPKASPHHGSHGPWSVFTKPVGPWLFPKVGTPRENLAGCRPTKGTSGNTERGFRVWHHTNPNLPGQCVPITAGKLSDGQMGRPVRAAPVSAVLAGSHRRSAEHNCFLI